MEKSPLWGWGNSIARGSIGLSRCLEVDDGVTALQQLGILKAA
jgi:hypothetical protein